jgi:glucans biosynthesis protein C
MRKNYIDNLRWLAILLLIPFHTAMIYNDFGENFYIRGPEIPVVSAFTIITYSWFMPLLFVLAGISAGLALQKRTSREFITERVYKLLVPLFYGILLIIPIQTYFAERFHNGYTGNYFQQYILFFTKKTDLTGYTGGFTTGHLWFILYLFVISLIALPVMLKYQRSNRKIRVENLTIPKLLPMFLIPLVMVPILNISGKSIGEYFALFLLGFFMLSQDAVIARLEKSRWSLITSAIIMTTAKLILYYQKILRSGIYADIYQRIVMWVSILAFLGLAKHYFDFRTNATAYLAKASFPIYIFHQTILVAVAYYVFQVSSTPAVQISFILIITILLTFAIYEILRRITFTRYLFAIKK